MSGSLMVRAVAQCSWRLSSVVFDLDWQPDGLRQLIRAAVA
jgi:hypothetical protein